MYKFITKPAALAVLALTSALAPAWAQPSKAPLPAQNVMMDGMEQTLTGLVTDAKCKGRVDRKGATLFSCARQCTHWEGQNYVLMIGDTAYVLNGHKDDLDRFAGQKAAITGHFNGNILEVDSVSKAQKRS
jgi:hypothetical protein